MNNFHFSKNDCFQKPGIFWGLGLGLDLSNLWDVGLMGCRTCGVDPALGIVFINDYSGFSHDVTGGHVGGKMMHRCREMMPVSSNDVTKQ